jgi:hypothetical protein
MYFSKAEAMTKLLGVTLWEDCMPYVAAPTSSSEEDSPVYSNPYMELKAWS